MNQSVWTEFISPLAKQFKIYTPDLPGFGQSRLQRSSFTIEEVADLILPWIESQSISNSVLVGHSLGGYVALAMARKRPDYFAGLGLFHSTANPDTDEKKISRTKTIEFVRKNGALAFTSNFIQPLFTNPNHEAVSKVKALSSTATEDAVVGYLGAMRDRPNSSDVLASFDKPILFIAGSHDQGISVASIHEQAALCKRPSVNVLDDSAHMGMFEEPEKARLIVQTFVNQCY